MGLRVEPAHLAIYDTGKAKAIRALVQANMRAHMDETPTTDADCDYRALSCEIAQWVFDGSSLHPASVEEFVAAAALVAHFITSGEGVSVQCAEDLRKTVSGL